MNGNLIVMATMISTRTCAHQLPNRILGKSIFASYQYIFPCFPKPKERSFHQLSSCGEWTLASQKRLHVALLKNRPVKWQNAVWHKQGSLMHARSLYRKFIKPKTVLQYKTEDDVESHYDLVYRGTVSPYVQLALGGVEFVALGFTATAIGVTCGLPLVFSAFSPFFQTPMELGIFVTINSIICVMIAKACKLVALRIYYSDVEDQFIVIFIGVHPFAIEKVQLNPGEVHTVESKQMTKQLLPWASDIYAAPSRKLIIYPHSFTSPVYFNRLLGYQ